MRKGAAIFFAPLSQISSDTLTNCSGCNFSGKKSEKDKITRWSDADWCSNCNLPASAGCFEGKHVIQNANELYTTCSQRLKVLTEETNNACEHALRDYHKITSAHEVILAWISWLHQKIRQRNFSNKETIGQLKSLKVTMDVHIPHQNDLSTTFNEMHQRITEFHDKLHLARTTQVKMNNLFQMYRNVRCETAVSAQLSSFLETPSDPVNWFSTALGHSNKPCMDVLSFLVRLLDKEQAVSENIPGLNCSGDKDAMMNQVSQAKNNSSIGDSEKISGKGEASPSCQDIQRTHKRRLDEAPESSTASSKKARLQSPDRGQNKQDRDELMFYGTNGNAVDLTLKAKMELQAATVNENFFQIVRTKLQSAENKLKLMEEKVADLTKEKACQSGETTNQIVRFETDLKLVVEKVELAENSEAVARPESSILFKLTKETRKKYAMVLVLSTADVEQLHVVRKQLETSRSRLAIVLQERTNQATPEDIETPKNDGGLAAKRYNQLQRLEVPVVAGKKVKQPIIICGNEQVKQQNPSENSSRKKDHLLSPPRDQHRFPGGPMQSAVQTLAQATGAQQTELGKGVVQQIVSNVIAHQKIKKLQVCNFKAIASDVLIVLHCQGTDVRYDVCTICKSKVETRFYCAKCEYFILCIPCYQKGKHCHKMEILGFNLDVQEQPADCTDIEEARKSKIDRRINSLLHSFQCRFANCHESYCKSMKAIISHNLSCKFKAAKSIMESILDSTSSCPTCAELVALIIYHAKLCTNAICDVPHCSSAKKKIKNFQNKLSMIQKAESEKLNEDPSSRPVSPSTQHSLTSASTVLLSKESLNTNQQQKHKTPKVGMDVHLWAMQHVAHVAPYVPGSTDGTKTGRILLPATNAEKLKIVQENIMLILHAHECHQGKKQRRQCPITHCQAMKDVLYHMRTCESVKLCIPHCGRHA
ncbi:uncharacterized protein LOC130688431 [Daphnia carinata]|uniref:uncharacterized protein LOC130688431 n=1 Tax=Daphnia carinata TaxID=120202 RepID=UPI0028689EA9|nr:uncharacterized protein LOC130688431 [Daphnia carinata]